MQLMENTAQEWADSEKLEGFAHEHCYDPVTNTLAGAYYLSKVLKRYRRTDDPLPYGLADYNAGRANVLKWSTGEASTNGAAFIEAIGFPGTRKYVLSVMRRYEHYRPIFLRE
jgi:soluble lytic murein transglycosylase